MKRSKLKRLQVSHIRPLGDVPKPKMAKLNRPVRLKTYSSRMKQYGDRGYRPASGGGTGY